MGGQRARARACPRMRSTHHAYDDARGSTPSGDATLARPDHDGAAHTDDFEAWKGKVSG